MHPLFPAHLIADFLLQPAWLAAWKQKSIKGILAHSAVHALVMTVLLLPNRLSFLFGIVILAILHGIIDYIKIINKKNEGSLGGWFFLDQAIHLLLLTIAAVSFPHPPAFWYSANGRGILFILLFYSFAFTWWNLARIPQTKRTNSVESLRKFAMLAILFIIYLVPAQLLSISSCSEL